MRIEARPRRALTPYRLRGHQFEQMIESGIISNPARVELIGGRLVRRMTKNDPHAFRADGLAEAIRPLRLGDTFASEEQSPAIDNRSRVEPDLQIVPSGRADYQPRRIDPAKDSGRRLRLDASAAIPSYGIVHIPRVPGRGRFGTLGHDPRDPNEPRRSRRDPSHSQRGRARPSARSGRFALSSPRTDS